MVNLILGFIVGAVVGGGGVFAITKAKAQQRQRPGFPPPNQGFPPQQGYPQPPYPPQQQQQQRPPQQW